MAAAGVWQRTQQDSNISNDLTKVKGPYCPGLNIELIQASFDRLECTKARTAFAYGYCKNKGDWSFMQNSILNFTIHYLVPPRMSSPFLVSGHST
jgi:hypothetical protein